MAKSLQTLLHEVIDLLVAAETGSDSSATYSKHEWDPGVIEPGGFASTEVTVPDAWSTDFVQVSVDSGDWLPLTVAVDLSAQFVRHQTVRIMLFNHGTSDFVPRSDTYYLCVTPNPVSRADDV